MAASCISLSVTAAGAFASATRDVAGFKQAGRFAFAVPSVSGASLERNTGVVAGGVALFGLSGGSRAGRNAAIAARAADLEQGLEEMQTSSPPPIPQGTKLYVGNLPWSVHSKQLAEKFQEVGNVELVEVIYDRETQKSRGFAFVTMSTVDDAVRAIERLDGHDLDGRVIKVNFPASSKDGFRSERPPRPYTPGGGGSYGTENKLFVGNLSWGVDDDSLAQLFSGYGTVAEAKVVYDRTTGRSRGFGFVTLSSSTEVNEAISSLDGVEYDGRELRVNLAGDKPPPREPRDY